MSNNQYFGLKTFFNENVEFYKDVYVHGNLYYDFTKNDIEFNNVKVNGEFNAFGKSNFNGNVDFNNSVYFDKDIDVDTVTIRSLLDVGIGGTTLKVNVETNKIGLGITNPREKLDIIGSTLISGKLGIGTTTPEQKIDVLGSIKIDEFIYDSVNSPGENGYYLSMDEGGIRWTSFEPNFTEGIFIQDEGVYIPSTGIAQSFTAINFKQINSFGSGTDNVIPIPNPSNPNFIADIQTQDFWGFNIIGDIYRMSKVGILKNNPTSTLDVNGSLNIDGSTILNSTLGVGGTTTLNDTLEVNAPANLNQVLGVAGAATLNGTLTVNNSTYLNGNLDVIESTLLRSTLDVDGATNLNNTLDVDGTTTLRSTLDVNDSTLLRSTLDVDGATNLNNVLDVDGATTLRSTLDVLDSTLLQGSLDVNGSTNLNNTLDVDGATNLNNVLDVDGATTLRSTLDVDGATNLNNVLDVDGATTLRSTLDVLDSTLLQGSLDVNGSTNLNNTLDVDGTTTLRSTLDVNGPTNLNNVLDVDGATTLRSTLGVTSTAAFGYHLYALDLLDVSGPTRLRDTLRVDSTTTLYGNLIAGEYSRFDSSVEVYGAMNIYGFTTLYDILSVEGATELNNTLDVDGATNLNNVLDVDGATTLRSTLDVLDSTLLQGSLDVNGSTNLNNTLDVDGATNLNNVLDVDGATTLRSTLDVLDSTLLQGSLDVNGSTNLNNTLDVDGTTTLRSTLGVGGDTTLQNSLIVVGLTTLSGSLDVNGTVNLNSALDVDGPTILKNTLNVVGPANVNSTLQVGTGVTIDSSGINAAGIVTASSFIGNGINLVGIVTQIIPSIGINVSSSQESGKGVVVIDSFNPTGKTIFVTQNGNDNNTGLSENDAKRTIKGASKVAVFGDTIKVYPGVYVEENPIVLKKTVSVEGTELRNCVVTPKYSYLDLFHVNNGCHITDMSFIGPNMTDGASVVALQPLEGVSVDRYFDAARMIRLNIDYIANETVGFLTSGFSGFAGSHREQDAARLIDLNIDFIAAETIGFLTSTDYKNPIFTVVNSSGIATDPINCEDDIKSILSAISYDLKAGSNKKSIGAGLSYYDSGGTLLHITGGSSVKEATIDAINYAVGIVTYVINNIDYASQPGITTYSSLTQNLSYSPILVSGGCTDTIDKIQNRANIITNIIEDFNYSAGITTIFGVTLESQDCADDIKNIWKCIIHDITRGGNSRCVGAGKSYYDENWNLIPQILKNPEEVSQTISCINYSFNVSRAIVNNVTWGGYPVGLGTNVVNALYNEITGVTSITAINHGLLKDDAVKINGLEFTCPSGPGIVTYPSGAFGNIFNVLNVIDDDNFEVVVGQSTLPHTYVSSSGTIQKYTSFSHGFYQVKDLAMQKDPLTGFNNGINGCSNVISAIHSCVGIVTSIIGLGSAAFESVGIRTTYPGNSGIGFTSTLGITSAVYNNVTGKTTIFAPGLNNVEGESIEIRDLEFSCSSNGTESTQIFPSGKYGYNFFIDKVNQDGSFDVYVGQSSLPHNYVGGGIVLDRTVAVTTATYDNITGITTIHADGLSIETGDLVKIRGLEFSCPSGSGTTTIYPTGNNGFVFKVLDIAIDKPIAIDSAVYDNFTGIATITAPGINVSYDNLVEIRDLEFSCPDSPPNLLYPSGKNGYKFRVLSSNESTFTINVGPSTIPHTYVSGGYAINRSKTSNDTFTINVGPSTIPHTYVSGGVVIPPYSKGVGPITQGPYIRNCTNFIPDSIGMKVDGFSAEPGDQDDIGVTGTMSVDSYTQYNQGGIGVSITNGAYAQLVSIFTICNDIAIFTESGGQCDITNSNSSFGRLGLVSKGVGDAETKSIYRYTGTVANTANAEQDVVTISGIGSYRPYDGQTLYFGELFYTVQRVEIINGGNNYTSPPSVVFDDPSEGVNGIRAEAIATIQNGSVISVDLISTGTQYKTPPKITFVGGGGSGAEAQSIMYPIYYTIESATLPSSGISTVTLNTNLNSTVSVGTTVYFTRLSLQITSSHSFEWVGSGNNINTAKPALGGVVIQENEVVKIDGGEVVYTSTDQAGNFRIGDGLVVNQLTGTVSGRAFNQSLLNTVTPLIIALGN